MIEFKVPTMSCGHCVGVVTQTVKRVDPQAQVQVDLASKIVQVDSAGNAQEFARALAEAGYPASA